MSPEAGGAALRAVPDGTAAAETAPDNGLTPPLRKAGSRFISDVIVEMGFAPRERVDAAVEEGKAAGRSPEQVLLESGVLTRDQLARALVQRFSLHHVDLDTFKPDLSALNLITPQAARRLGAVPIGLAEDGTLMVALADPSNVLALDDLKLMTRHELRPVVASPDDILGVIARMSRLDEAVAEAVQEGEEELPEAVEIR
jgi:type IV pilus assembly protein PilB